ncbi:MAG TPA: hotdog domain-containing protein [Pseudonocardiaceae bacterium]
MTLLEEARTELLFNEKPRRRMGNMGNMGNMDGGIVVSRLTVEYLAPLVWGGPVRVEAWVRSRPRRFGPAERDFLAPWTVDGVASA